MKRRQFLPLLSAPLFGQEGARWFCPMDPDVRSSRAGVCPRCGMKLVEGGAKGAAYPVRIEVEPRDWKPGGKIRLRFEVTDPATGKRATSFQQVHERLMHVFLVSGDLEFFAHEHPERQEDGTFVLDIALPKEGAYRVGADFYPDGGLPQMAVSTLLSANAPLTSLAAPKLAANLTPQKGRNVSVSLSTDPEPPAAGKPALLYFEIEPWEGLEPYLGAWGHLVAASGDLTDLLHTHPTRAHGGWKEQFTILFPRAEMYRVWAQFQRQGVVNTVSFTIPVKAA